MYDDFWVSYLHCEKCSKLVVRIKSYTFDLDLEYDNFHFLFIEYQKKIPHANIEEYSKEMIHNSAWRSSLLHSCSKNLK